MDLIRHKVPEKSSIHSRNLPDFTMSLSMKPCILLLVSCCLTFCSFADLSCTNFVFKHCANETFAEDMSRSYSKSLTYLFQNLTAQSLQSKFFTTTSGSEKSSVSGVFRCREGLSNEDCHSCVKKLPEVTKSICNNTKSAKVQLAGCYMSYSSTDEGNSNSNSNTPPVVEEEHEPRPHLRYTKCEDHEEEQLPFGFRELMDAGFLELEHGIGNSHDGYYSTNYELVHMLAQCEEEFRGCECRECIHHAVQIAQEECEHSASGEIYMDHCYIRYGYYPHGIPHEDYPAGGSGSGAGAGAGHDEGEYHEEHGLGKSVAIAIGGAAVLILAVIFLLCVKAAAKKDDDC